MQNNDKQRYYPLRDPENPTKITLISITEEQYHSLYPEIWRIRNREQNHGCCMCPKCYLWKCDSQCDLCEYHAPNTISFNDPLPDGEGTLGDYIPDDNSSIEDVVADRQLLAQLIDRLRQLDPEADTIIQLWKDHPEGISDRKIAEALGRPQRTFADQMKKYRTDLRRIRNGK
jgi:hypothetical protein